MGEPQKRTHADTMLDYIKLLKRDLSEYMDAKVIVRMFDTGETRRDAWAHIRNSKVVRKKKRRLREAEDHLDRHLAGTAYWKEKEVCDAQAE